MECIPYKIVKNWLLYTLKQPFQVSNAYFSHGDNHKFTLKPVIRSCYRGQSLSLAPQEIWERDQITMYWYFYTITSLGTTKENSLVMLCQIMYLSLPLHVVSKIRSSKSELLFWISLFLHIDFLRMKAVHSIDNS